MSSIPKILVDTSVHSVGLADPASWTRVAPKPLAGNIIIGNKLILYCGRKREQGSKKEKEMLYIQGIGNQARNGELLLYTYPEIRWENWLGYQSVRNNTTPFYAFRDVSFSEVDSPIERGKLFQSAEWVYGEEVEKFIDWLLKFDTSRLPYFKHPKLTDYEIKNLNNIQEFRELCSDKIFGRKRGRDAFHFWTAECANLDYFLTVDYKFINVFNNAKRQNKISSHCRPISPIELGIALNISIENIEIPKSNTLYTLNGVEYRE